MATPSHLFDLPEEICYVQCGFCTAILLVSVPCSSLSMVVTVTCGHCTGLLSVNMMKVSFVPFHLFASLGHDDHEQKEEGRPEEADAGKAVDAHSSSLVTLTSSDNEEEEKNPANSRAIYKPPEKRQRAPSAYNRFIKEEIRRLKAENPNMAHREAFSTAAKNWANFPHIHYMREDGESCGQDEESTTWSFTDAVDEYPVNSEGRGFLQETRR